MQGQIVVADSSVIIDIEHGGFLVAAFSLQFDFCVPDLLYERELRAHGGETLLEYGLETKVLSDAEVLQAEHYRRTARGLSRSDTFLLTLALKLDCMFVE